ncbi:unnamed protein product, partial [Didymodactylos carnosus]
VELLNVAIAAQSYIGETILTLNQIENGYLMYEDNQGLVTCVCFSPDGAAIGTGTDTGEIKFFSINFDQPNSCGCLHCWVPHDGRPISCLYFLDDHKNLTQDTQLWRYAISGCDFNSELKIWSCKNWCCLQIIRFQYSFMEISPLVHSQTKLLLKSSIDLTSHFLVLSDINRKCLYVLTIFQDSEQNRAEFTSINEFLLKAPALSFVITAADRLNRKNVSEQSQQQNENSMATYAVKLYSIHTKFFQELLVIFETKNFIHTNTTILSPIVHNHHTSNTFSNHSPLKYSDDIIDDFRFDSYNSQLITRDRSSFPPPPSSDRLCLVGDLMTMPNYSIDDLLSPNSSLTNVTRDTTRSFLAADGLSNGANNHISTTPTVDPIHGLLLGSTTAFDPIHRSVHHQTPLTSPPQQQTTAIHPQSLINEMFSHGLIQTTATTADTTNKTRKLNNRGSTSPFDLDDKEVAESMAGTTNYQHQFDVLVNDTDDVDNVFIPIKTNDDELDQLDENGQVNESRTQDPLLSPQKYGEASLWSKSCHSRNDSPMNRQAMGDFSATETSDKDDDSTADEGEQQPQTHPRIKRRARSPNSILPLQSGSIGNEALHAIRELSSQLSSFRVNYLIQPPPLTSSSTATTAITNPQDFSEKLERCSQRIEQLTNKFDRFMTLDQQQTPGANIHSILSTRPNPSDNVTSNNGSLNSDLNLTDAHYARLENILVEKIQVYVQGAVKAVFEPYKDLKDNLHKDLAHKLLSTDNVIKSTMTQIFRSKTMIDSLSNAVAGTVQSTMISTYRDAFNQIVIPSFEKAALNMFQQCNEAFKKGTKEYLQEMAENGRQQQRLSQQQREQVLSEVKKETVILLKDFERKCQEVCLTVKNDFNQYMRTNLTSVICDTSQTVLKNETSLLLHELFTNQKNDINNLLLQHFQRFQQQQQSQQSPQQTVPSKTRTTTSRTTTPLPVLNDNSQQQQHETKQQYVLNLVRHGQINQAFESVLSAGDLNLVIFLCENLRPSQLFSIQPLPLQTPVLLSLIHQLAADLIHHQEVKYNYLQEALIFMSDVVSENVYSKPVETNYDIDWSMLDKKLYFPLSLLSTFTIRCLLYPFTLVRTRLQVQVQQSIYNGTWDALKTTVKLEGFHSLYRGFWIYSYHLIPGEFCLLIYGLYQVFYISRHLKPQGFKRQTYHLIHTLEALLEEVLQVSPDGKILNAVKPFYRGYILSSALFGLTSSIWWPAYYFYQNQLLKIDKFYLPLIIIQCISGPLSSLTSTLLTNPLDVCRTRVQVDKDKRPYRHIIKQLWQEERMSIFTKGLTARLTHSCIYSLFVIFGYETVKRLSLKEEYKSSVRW